MCICFVFVNDVVEESGYQLIIINNRDESYKRPTKPAMLWNDSCISGLDQEPQKENGTWLGLNTSGKIGILLNILELNCDSTKKGRGFLVTDYIAGCADINQYSSSIAQERHQYNRFNLVLLQKKMDGWCINMVSTEGGCSSQPLKRGILAFGNSAYDKPWKKVQDGKVRFEEIVKRFNDVKDKDLLKEEMLKMLADKESHWPDDQLQSQLTSIPGVHQSADHSKDLAMKFSCNFVEIPEKHYGTRTHSLILIDGKGQGEYVEVNMKELIRINQPMWEESTIKFQLLPPS